MTKTEWLNLAKERIKSHTCGEYSNALGDAIRFINEVIELIEFEVNQ